MEEAKLMELGAEKFITHECDCLSRHDPEQTRCNAFPEGKDAFFFGNYHTSLKETRVFGHFTRADNLLLETCLDNI